MPNLITDRGFGLGGIAAGGNVRRLMYQPLIWRAALRHEARRLRSPLDAQDMERLADTLVHCMRRNAQLGGDFLRVEMLVNEPEAIQLPGAQPRYPFSNEMLMRQ